MALPVRLEREQVVQWERQWGGRVEHWKEQGGVGKQWTAVEREVDKGERRLAQGDPLPRSPPDWRLDASLEEMSR
jgi:hypothetical protein